MAAAQTSNAITELSESEREIFDRFVERCNEEHLLERPDALGKEDLDFGLTDDSTLL